MKASAKGITVTELVVIVASLAILIAIGLPKLQNVRDAAWREACSDNMRQLAEALNKYHDSNGAFPPALVIGGATSAALQREPAPLDGVFWSWAYRISPFFDFQEFFEQVDPVEDFPFWSYFGPDQQNAGLALISQQHKLLSCPSDPRFPLENWVDPNNQNNQAAVLSYLGVNGRNQFAEESAGGQDGMLYVNSSVTIDEVTDGISNTILLGERPAPENLLWGWQWAGVGGSPGNVFFGTTDVVLGVHEWASFPSNPAPTTEYFRPGKIDDPANVHRYHFWSFHPQGGNWAFVDGSVRFLTYDVDSAVNETANPGLARPTILAQFATRADGFGVVGGEFDGD